MRNISAVLFYYGKSFGQEVFILVCIHKTQVFRLVSLYDDAPLMSDDVLVV